jgi:membrane associated rhomboid family serine protease
VDDQFTQGSGEPVSLAPAEPTKTKIDWSASAVTFALIAVNVLVFLVMVLRGVSFLSPTTSSVLAWGADYGPYTLGGQWWRMFTSMFIHFGIIHIFMNMFVLLSIGMFMESLSGRVSYLILYVVAGLGGGVASLAWHPTTVSAGASGAVFGLYGGLLGFLVRHRDVINPEVLKSLRKGALTFVGYNIIFGLLPGIDMAAHVGGLVTGFLLGLFLVVPYISTRSQEKPKRHIQNAIALVIGIALVLVPLRALPKPGDFIGELNRMDATEDASLKLYNDSLEKWKAHSLSNQQFADLISQQLLPKWRTERDALTQLQHLSASEARLAAKLVKYMNTREEAWTALAEGLRDDDQTKLNQSFAKNREADQLAATLGGNK